MVYIDTLYFSNNNLLYTKTRYGTKISYLTVVVQQSFHYIFVLDHLKFQTIIIFNNHQ
jgi:hypothetical protein